jgi:molybdate transport system substrate-binding protein
MHGTKRRLNGMIPQASCALLIAAACSVVGCNHSSVRSLNVFAAVSTRDALEEIAERFQSETGITVRLSLGSSADLARQIEQGAHADLFLSADENWADYLRDKGLICSRTDLLSNELVVVVPVDTALVITKLEELPEVGIQRLALAGPAVPAGRYAREALRTAGIMDSLDRRILNAQDVRAALTYVARGEADAGIVYATDARSAAKVRVALRIPSTYHAAIRYPLTSIKQETDVPGVRRFFDYLCTQAAQEIFQKAGFSVPPAQPPARTSEPH